MTRAHPGGRGAQGARSETWESLEQVCTASARAIVKAQLGLDSHAWERLRRWESEGLPPWASALTKCRLQVQVAVGCIPKEAAGQWTRLWLGTSGEGMASVSFTIRHLPARQPG
jgi:hypothetical protein